MYSAEQLNTVPNSQPGIHVSQWLSNRRNRNLLLAMIACLCVFVFVSLGGEHSSHSIEIKDEELGLQQRFQRQAQDRAKDSRQDRRQGNFPGRPKGPGPQDAEGVDRSPSSENVDLQEEDLGREGVVVDHGWRTECADGVTFNPEALLITWVNGQDPEFLEQCSAHRSRKCTKSHRFADHQELKYALRSIEKNMQWYDGPIYVYTNGQATPDWLNTDHDRLHILRHQDVFRNHSNLPTFSSRPIEGSFRYMPFDDQFIYFNDDFLVGAPTQPCDFAMPHFNKNSYSKKQTSAALRKKGNKLWLTSVYNTLELLDRVYPGVRQSIDLKFNHHSPYLISKKRMQRIEKHFPDEVAATESHRFRQSDDIAWTILHNTLWSMEKVEQGEEPWGWDEECCSFFQIGPKKYLGQKEFKKGSLHKKFLCFNDEGAADSRVAQKFQDLLVSLFPEPSSFEFVGV